MDEPIKLLIIDDDDVDRMMLKRSLSATGFRCEVHEYSHIEQISRIDGLNAFDCIFLDYLLPGQNGLFWLNQIRDAGIKAPIVIVTSQGSETIAVDLMKSGANDYVVKDQINPQTVDRILTNSLRTANMLKEKERAEHALKISESRLAEAQRIARLGNWEVDLEKNSIFCSDEVYRIFEIHSVRERAVEEWFSAIHPDDRQVVRQKLKECIEGATLSVDFRILVSRKTKFMTGHGRAVLEPDGTVKRLVGTVQDITSRKVAEEEVAAAVRLSEQSLKVREIFLANMSHEIRTPMNAIMGFTRLLYDTQLTHEQKGFIDAIHFSGENLLVIINDILDLSKIRTGKIALEKSEFSLSELVDGITSIVRPRAMEKRLILSAIIDPKVPAMIKGDAVRLSQVLTNLLANAIKFTDEGRVSLRIDAEDLTNDRAWINFTVMDTGIGIAPDQHALIFDSFVQASGETTRKYGGTGLGLAIVKNLVELQDGTISLESQIGEGAAFTVRLPFDVAPSTRSKLPGGDACRAEELTGLRVLVVEDNAVNQLLVKNVLTRSGCAIDLASNGKEALVRLDNKTYDVILMDVQMPEMDGYEATARIRSGPAKISGIPIIAMTAHAFGSDARKCLDAGMSDYISKPFDPSDLREKLVKYVPQRDAKIVRFDDSSSGDARNAADLSFLCRLGKGDDTFVDQLVEVYKKQTPVFAERLKAYGSGNNFGAIQALCHQIRSSYGILKVNRLTDTLDDIFELLSGPLPEQRILEIRESINSIVSLICAINDQVQRGLRRTG